MYTFIQPAARCPLSQCEIHGVLSNARRRAVLEYLGTTPRRVGVRELSEAIAAEESGQSPPPRRVRESVYTALHQTHLPKLDDLGIVAYDRDASEIYLLGGARTVDRYRSPVTRLGLTWGEWYRALGVVGLTLVVASLASVPVVSAVEPLVFASGFLALFSVASVYQLWTDRWRLLHALRHRTAPDSDTDSSDADPRDPDSDPAGDATDGSESTPADDTTTAATPADDTATAATNTPEAHRHQ